MLSKQFHLFCLNCDDIPIFSPGLKTQKIVSFTEGHYDNSSQLKDVSLEMLVNRRELV